MVQILVFAVILFTIGKAISVMIREQKKDLALAREKKARMKNLVR